MSFRKCALILLATSAVAILAIPVLWAIFFFGYYLGYGNYKVRGHQEFARNGVSQVKPATEMDHLFDDCRHYITYGPNDVPLFNSVAYFGDRYELTMQVAVRIQSATRGAMIGKPQFYLKEVSTVAVSPSGQIQASFSRNLNFGAAKWRQVYDSDGDFSTIGFNVDTSPVPDFRKYADATRPSN